MFPETYQQLMKEKRITLTKKAETPPNINEFGCSH
jgi:hypothetical protein